jgi:hypothetical protein
MLLSPKRLMIVVAVAVVLLVLFLPALVAYRYTAPAQRGEFVSSPWRGWAFVAAALRVPGDSRLKTSGAALRKANWIFKEGPVDPREVQLLFVPQDEPYTLVHAIDGRTATTTVEASYRFIWQVQGSVRTVSDSIDTIVALLDYETGRLLYDVRDDLRPEELAPPQNPAGASATAQ